MSISKRIPNSHLMNLTLYFIVCNLSQFKEQRDVGFSNAPRVRRSTRKEIDYHYFDDFRFQETVERKRRKIRLTVITSLISDVYD